MNQPKPRPKKAGFYLKWPWDLVLFLVLAALLRLAAVPVILLFWVWNQRRQPPGEYCLRRTRGRLVLALWGLLALALGAGAVLLWPEYWSPDRAGWAWRDYLNLALCAGAAVAGPVAGLALIWLGLRDAFFPAKSRLARSIREQLPYPEEAPPVEELFRMVDQDLAEHGEWFGKLGIGSRWVLGQEATDLERVRGVFGRNETRTCHSGGRTRVVRTIQLWLVDDRQHRRCTDLADAGQLEGAMDCLRRRVPQAVFGVYDSPEYRRLADADEETAQRQELEYRRRKSALAETEARQQAARCQNQVLTLPSGEVTSRFTGESLCRLLEDCRRSGEIRPFSLEPGVPLAGQGAAFCRLVCHGGQPDGPARFLLEEDPGSARQPVCRGWSRQARPEEARRILQDWAAGRAPSLEGWARMERQANQWQFAEREYDWMD